MSRVCFIVNPRAGRGRALTIWKQLEPLAAQLGAYEVRYTQYARHGEEIARQAVRQGFDRVAAVGGDGTINEVGNGLVGTESALAMVPAGTGNDFIKSAAIPKNPQEALRLAFTGHPHPIDVGHAIGHRYFFNISGTGFDAATAQTIHTAWYKRLGSALPYVLAVLQTLVTYRPVPMEVEIDGQIYQRKALLISVGISQYTGGGMLMLPDARLDDGLFDVVVGGDLTRLESLGLLPKIFHGGHKQHPKVEFLRGRQVTIRSAQRLPVHLDGDLVGDLPVRYELLPGALRVVVGPGWR